MSRPPLFTSLAGYQRSWLTPDLIAGLTVWAVLVPEALAYATIAGVSPVVGLYAAPAALLLYAVFGSSKHLVVGPMSSTAALSAAAVAALAAGGSHDFVALTAGLAIATGVAGLVAGLARLGFLASFISQPVFKGFIVGLAMTIIVGQLPKLFGVPGGSGDFFEKCWDLIKNLPDTQGLTLLVGATSLATVILLRRFAPKVPGSLVVVVLGVAAVKVFNLDQHGVEIVGPIQSGLPHVGLPDVSLSQYGKLAGAAMGILLVGFAEGLGAAKTYAARNHYTIDPNRELIGLGAANLGAGFTSGMVVNGSLSKTAVNGDAGARTQLSGLIVAALTILTLLFLTGLFEDLPEATLAAVVVAAVIELVNFTSLARLYRVYTAHLGNIYGPVARPDFIGAMAALLGVLIFDTLPGLFIGIVVSVLLLVYRASRPNVALLGRGDDGTWVDVSRNPSAKPEPGVVVVRPESGLFFANADNVHTDIRAELTQDTTAVVLDLQAVPTIDISAVDMLVELVDDLTEAHIRLFIARDIGQVSDLLRSAGDEKLLDHLYPTVREAVAACAHPPREPDASP